MTNFILVLTTTDSRDHARSLSKTLIQEKLAACVEFHQVDSLYQWEGDLCDTVEFALMIKTQAALYPKIEQRIKELHHYKLPQIIATPISHGLKGYLDWVAAETRH